MAAAAFAEAAAVAGAAAAEAATAGAAGALAMAAALEAVAHELERSKNTLLTSIAVGLARCESICMLCACYVLFLE